MEIEQAYAAGLLDDKPADTHGPQYYKTMGVEPWEVMQALLTPEEWAGYLKGNIIKYAMRQGRKLGSGDDAEKARHYAQKLGELLQERRHEI